MQSILLNQPKPNGRVTDEQLQQWKAEKGELLHLTTPLGDLVFEGPSQAVWDRFVETCQDDKKSKARAMTMLSLGCLVYPDDAQARSVFSKYPGLPAKLADKLGELAGVGDQFELKNV